MFESIASHTFLLCGGVSVTANLPQSRLVTYAKTYYCSLLSEESVGDEACYLTVLFAFLPSEDEYFP